MPVSIEVRTPGVAEALKRIQRWPTSWRAEVMVNTAQVLASAVNQEAGKEIRRKQLSFRGHLAQSLQTAVLTPRGRAHELVIGKVFSELEYAPVREFGRRAGAAPPPVHAIQAWADAKGMNAYAVAKSIAKRGSPPPEQKHRKGFMAAAAKRVQRKAAVIAARVVDKWIRTRGGV